MARENLTFGDAINRVNGLVEFYSKERARLEDNLTKLLLPLGLTFAAGMLKDAMKPEYLGAAIFLGAFFLFYVLLIYYDLCVNEVAWSKAFNLQGKLYAHENTAGSSKLDAVVPADVIESYDEAEARVGKPSAIRPFAKPLISLGCAVTVLITYWLIF